MKLLTNSGLLFAYANAAAQTQDGNMGAYAMVDWSAIFNEVHLVANTDLSYTNKATATIGLAPAVTSLITTFDGGKVMAGYSVFNNMTTVGWVIKLWGHYGATMANSAVTTSSTTTCDQYDVPAGHVVFATYPVNVKGTASACKTTTQWTWIEPGANIADMAYASVYLAAAEDFTTDKDLSYIYIGGGLEARASYGLGTYNQFLFSLDYDGAIYNGVARSAAGFVEGSVAHK